MLDIFVHICYDINVIGTRIVHFAENKIRHRKERDK